MLCIMKWKKRTMLSTLGSMNKLQTQDHLFGHASKTNIGKAVNFPNW
jgi:hypothetical protein